MDSILFAKANSFEDEGRILAGLARTPEAGMLVAEEGKHLGC